MKRYPWAVMALLTLVAVISAGCAAGTPVSPSGPGAIGTPAASLRPAKLAGGERLRVVASTAILGDVVANVGGDAIQLTTLIGPGQDPHAYEPTPRDVAAIDQANIVFINGLGLEAGLETTIRSGASKGQPVIAVSDGVQPLTDPGQPNNPHVWFDPGNVKIWVKAIASALAALDPAHAAAFQANAAAYDGKLDELDNYVRSQVAKIPAERRKLVTDHEALGYFASHYGFTIVGAVVPSVSTSAEPSAGDLADLVGKIRAEKVPAVFIGTTANPKISEMVAGETGAKVLPLYSESLGAPGSGADTYLGMMRTDIDTIVKGLGQS